MPYPVAAVRGGKVMATTPGYTYPAGTLAGEVERLTASGDYSLTCGSGAEALPVEFVNNAGAVTISADTNWGNATADERLLAVRVRGNLTIDATKTLTAAARKLGLFVLVDGDVTVNGTLSMTARGANHSATGSDLTAFAIRVHEATDDADNLIPAAGAAGGTKTGIASNGSTGSAGVNGQCGGGGSGGIRDPITCNTTGATGTAYGGGGGGGGIKGGAVSTIAGERGGAGGNGAGIGGTWSCGGGAGNPGGNYVGTTNPKDAGDDGTGGVLIIVATNIGITAGGVISSNGKTGGDAYSAGGGGSGAGSISLYYKTGYSNLGTVQANGGAGGAVAGYPNGIGGSGGAGSIRIREVTV